MTIQPALSDAEIAACFSVLRQLRPRLGSPEELVERVRRQAESGYRLAMVRDAGRVTAVAGYRYGESLSAGRYLYVDDLVTDAACRSQGHGEALFGWLIAEARAAGCDALHLDSGVQRFAAHRFYFRQRMHISDYHFALPLGEAE